MNWVKNAIMQVTYFLNSGMSNFLFYCHIILYWQKVTSYEKFSHIYPWSPTYLENFSFLLLWIEVWKCWKIVKFPKISIKRETVKHFTKPKQQATWRTFFSLPPTHIRSDKNLLRLWNKNFLTVIYRNIQTFIFKVFKNVILGRQKMVQYKCIFWREI